jgi:hypothetical protein
MKSTENFCFYDFFFPESLLVVSYIPLYHGPMRDNTYKFLVEEDILLHNVLVVDNYDIPMVLYLIQNLLSLVLHLCHLLDLLSMHCTEIPDCTVSYCTEVVLHCIVVAWFYRVALQYYAAATWCCMEMELG